VTFVAASGLLTGPASQRAFSVPARAVVTADADSKGLWAAMFGSTPKAMPPLTQPLLGVEYPAEPNYPATPPATKVTTLKNGVRIATEDTPGQTVTVGVYVDCGSKYEAPGYQGASHLLERMAFKGTANRSHLRITREAEAIGAHLQVSGAREQMSYTADVLKGHFPEAVELLADVVVNPKFKAHELVTEMVSARAAVRDMASVPTSMVQEGLHTAAYNGGLGNPYLYFNGPLSTGMLEHFQKTNFTGDRVVVSAAGVDHAAFVGVAEDLFGALPASTQKTAPVVSEYKGGDFREFHADKADPNQVTVALGFEMKGGWKDLKNTTALSVLVTLLGGGGSFSAGGPGKGMYSRLYQRVLNRHAWISNCTAFQNGYNDTGLVGLLATCPGDKAGQVVDIMVAEMHAVAGADGAISATELSRAKNATIAAVNFNLESKAIVCEDIGRQLLTYGERVSAEQFVKDVNALSAKDLQACAKALIKTPLTMASLGQIEGVPKYDDVAKKFAK